MKDLVRLVVLGAGLAAAFTAAGAWEELRKNDSQRLSIDAKSIKKKGDLVTFTYLVDFRQRQGDFKTAEYRSLTVKAAISCKARTIVMGDTEVFAGNEANGPATGIMKPTGDDAKAKPIEAGTSDEELYARVCKPATAKAPPKAAPTAPAAPKK